MESLNKNFPSPLILKVLGKRALLLCRGQAGFQYGRSLRVCLANPHGLTLGNRRLLQKYQPVAPTQIQLSSSLALIPINSSSLGAPRERNSCTSSAYKIWLCHTKTPKGPLGSCKASEHTKLEVFHLHSHLCAAYGQSQRCLLSALSLTPEKTDLQCLGLRCHNISTTAGLKIFCR